TPPAARNVSRILVPRTIGRGKPCSTAVTAVKLRPTGQGSATRAAGFAAVRGGGPAAAEVPASPRMPTIRSSSTANPRIAAFSGPRTPPGEHLGDDPDGDNGENDLDDVLDPVNTLGVADADPVRDEATHERRHDTGQDGRPGRDVLPSRQ